MLPPGVPRLAVEAAATFGWERWADAAVGIDRFGASAPGAVALEELGINPDHVVARALALLAAGGGVAHDAFCSSSSTSEGQSPWLDNLRRGYLTSGQLAAAA